MNEKEQWIAERIAPLELACFSDRATFDLAIYISATHQERENIQEFLRAIAANQSTVVLLAACNDLRQILIRVINRHTQAAAEAEWAADHVDSNQGDKNAT
jgi:hypothetical protein